MRVVGALGAKPGRRERLTEAEQAVLAAHIFRSPDPDRDGVSGAIVNIRLACAPALEKDHRPSDPMLFCKSDIGVCVLRRKPFLG